MVSSDDSHIEPFGTRAVLLTPVGRGAVATVLVEGTNATEAVGRWFQPASGKLLCEIALGRIVFGRWRTEEGEGEELVVCRRSDTQIEVHCHGGVAAAENILQSLAKEGFATFDWQTWARHTGPDPIAATARVALAASRTERAALVLLDQYNGALRTAIERAATYCEVGKLEQAASELNELLRYENLGRHLATPWRVVLAGAPNVGKSSLINALLGFERAIVFDEPGTTRDVLTALTALDGWPVELADTAGLRTADDDIEAQGVAKAREQIAAADLVLLVFEASQPWSPADQALADSVPTALVVLNKCDLLPVVAACRAAMDRGENIDSAAVGNAVYGVPPGSPDRIYTSATTGVGIEELTREISRRLVPEAPPSGAAVPFTCEQVKDIRTAIELVGQGNGVGAASLLRACSTPSPLAPG